jgi:hypothetical protein
MAATTIIIIFLPGNNPVATAQKRFLVMND